MNVSVEPGKYVIAVSGGVDSMVLLHLLAGQPGLELVVAHFEHGIRPDSDDDRRFVGEVANALNLPFIYEHGDLGADASEATAREARYDFLEKAREERGAQAIITAHHQDDLLETAIINLLRGTGRKGLTALASNRLVIRPLLHIPKADIVDYAQAQAIAWHEDSTNSDNRYLRNHIRRVTMSKMSRQQREALLGTINALHNLNTEIDTLLHQAIAAHTPAERALSRPWFISLPYDVSAEVMAAWLRSYGVRDFSKQTISRLVVAAKTAQTGKRFDVQSGYQLQIGKNTLQLLSASDS